ncbi:hypothetical protein DRQ26_03445, partial [bacterium]
QSIPLANAAEARRIYDGTGISIAIVDTGIDYTHPRLGNGGFPNFKVIGGTDTGMGDNDPMAAGVAHGTCCAGIAAGDLGTVGDYIGGVAYNSKLYALKADIDNSGGMFTTNALLAAWDWCITHQYDDPANPILVMSNSWALYGFPFSSAAAADQFDPAFTAAADTAVAAGMTIVAGSGNDGFAGQGISWPAAMSKVISVGAVYDTTDQVPAYSNSHGLLDILAPADPMYTTDIVGAGGYDPGDYFPYFNGTSSACPFAAGSVAVIQRAAFVKTGSYLTPNEIRSILILTGDPVTDTKVAITKPRINLGAAIGGLGGLPIYIEEGCVLNEWVAPDTNDYWGWEPNYWDAAFSSNVIEEDPNFIYGYYLSQFRGGQVVESNCVDGGSKTSGLAGFSPPYTTAITGFRDTREVDMGYHYKAPVSRYDLTVLIFSDPNDPDDPNNYGTVDPNSGSYYAGTKLTLHAIGANDAYLEGWYDANGVLLSTNKNFDVVMDSNQLFVARFRWPQKIEVSGGGGALVNAVNAAQNGDTLVVAPGTYDGGIDYAGKEIKLFSTNPDDPNIVARTIISGPFGVRAVTFSDGEDAGSVLDGFTLYLGDVFDNGGAIYVGPDSSPTIVNVDIQDCWVYFGNGGAIYVDANSSPVFKNVTIADCIVWSGSGGGIYLDVNSAPTFVDCEVTNCRAWGGSGGAAYCNTDSNSLFTDSSFTDCYANFNGGGFYYNTKSISMLSRCELINNTTGSDGGGIYYAADCVAELIDCNIIGSYASGNGGGILCSIDNTLAVVDCNITDGTAVFGAGLYFEPNCAAMIAQSDLLRNSASEDGGAAYYTYADGISISDCNVSYNSAVRGGGLFSMESPDSQIIRCSIQYNDAARVALLYDYWMTDPNDPNFIPYPVPFPDPNDPNIISVPYVDRSGLGQGGGIYSFAGPTLIKDCEISGNWTSSSGGGIYLAGGEYDATTLWNCVISDNGAVRDGAGVSNNWQNELVISNCTIADNLLSGNPSYGGGLSCLYDANALVIDSILWGNAGSRGSEIAVGSGDWAYPLASQVKVVNSDVDLRTNQAVSLIEPDSPPVLRPGFDLNELTPGFWFGSGFASIGFPVNFMGVTYPDLYVNENGNITFDAPLSPWGINPTGLTSNIGTAIIAPFLADVDTSVGAPVTYGQGMVNGRSAFGVNWVNVGYARMNVDKLNSFQLVLIDRSDIKDGDFDIEFNYQSLTWETGDWDGGFMGFGGDSARAGFSNGSGVLGTFYELPGSGVSRYLLNSSPTGLIYGSRNSIVPGRY